MLMEIRMDKFEKGKESIRMICLGKGAEKDRKEERMNFSKKC